MTRTAASPILHLIRRVAEDQRLKDLPDSELLRRFVTGQDQAAFEALLRRHGSMVLDVCRNVQRDEQDAEDSFQATFLVLAQKAGSIRKSSSVGSWLYGVAYRTATKARARSRKRQKQQACLPNRTSTLPEDDRSWQEVQHFLYAELNCLAERYRAPLVHCYLESKSQHEAAGLLGVSRATLQKRLDTGRALLRARLVRRGLGPAAILAMSAWPSAKLSALVPVALLDSTIKASVLIGAGEAVKGLISPQVLALKEGVLKAMFLTKLKVVTAAVLTVLVGAGLVGWSYQVTAAQTSQPQQQGQQEAQFREGRPPRQPGHAQSSPAADELDALRLEIDALRKEVRADRERIKALEAEVHGRNEKSAGLHPEARSEFFYRFPQDEAGAQKRNQSGQQPGNPHQRQKFDSSDRFQQPDAGAERRSQRNRFPQDEAGAENRSQPGQQPGNPDRNAPKFEFFYRSPDAGADKQPGQPGQQNSPNAAGKKTAQWSDPMDSFLAPSQRRQRPSDAFAEAESALRKLRQNPHDKQAAQALEKATQRLKAEAAGERGEDPNSKRSQVN
jgi:RNA polymerase sigma factor (sigma-70 family)